MMIHFFRLFSAFLNATEQSTEDLLKRANLAVQSYTIKNRIQGFFLWDRF